MRLFYFGPYKEPGHFLFLPGGARASREDEALLPWAWIDGVLQQNCKIKFMRWATVGQENQGEALLHHRDGWTALSFWDRSVDRRGACNSNFFIDKICSFSEMLTICQQNFTERFLTMGFMVYPAERPNNSALCPAAGSPSCHVPARHYPDGQIDANMMNVCGGCKAVIGNWRGLWVSLDSWTIAHVRDNKRFEL